MIKLTTLEIEVIVAEYFDSRVNVIVPNIHWGMSINHECDLFLLTPSGYGYEVEIKTSLQDLKKDVEKTHGHRNKKIKRLYFALPETLIKYTEYIPDRAGILSINENRNLPIWARCIEIRKAETNSNYKFSDEERYNLTRLGTMRIWTLKESIYENSRQNEDTASTNKA